VTSQFLCAPTVPILLESKLTVMIVAVTNTRVLRVAGTAAVPVLQIVENNFRRLPSIQVCVHVEGNLLSTMLVVEPLFAGPCDGGTYKLRVIWVVMKDQIKFRLVHRLMRQRKVFANAMHHLLNAKGMQIRKVTAWVRALFIAVPTELIAHSPNVGNRTITYAATNKVHVHSLWRQ
jgi:hypothetical protein